MLYHWYTCTMVPWYHGTNGTRIHYLKNDYCVHVYVHVYHGTCTSTRVYHGTNLVRTYVRTRVYIPSPQDVALRGVMQALVRIQAYMLADIVVAIPAVDLAIEAVV